VVSRTFTQLSQYSILTLHSNVNVFALAFITTLALVLTICNLLVLRFLVFLSRFRPALTPRIDRWVQDGVFQLQRRAFEATEQGVWINLEQEIPVTCERQQLRGLPVELSFVSQPMEKRFVKKGGLKRSGTAGTEVTIVEVDEKKFVGEQK
jgi:hypothetical protein